jgi:hypothetical protein
MSSNALKVPNRINQNLHHFEIVIGAHPTCLYRRTGNPFMFVWRPALSKFLHEIFKHRSDRMVPSKPHSGQHLVRVLMSISVKTGLERTWGS